MDCKGLHCDGCGHGNSGGVAGAVIALLVIVALALRKAWPEIVSALEIAGWTVAAATGAAIVITGTVLATRALRRRRARRTLIYRPGLVIQHARLTERPIDQGAERPAIGAAREYQPGSWPLSGWAPSRPHVGDDRHPR